MTDNSKSLLLELGHRRDSNFAVVVVEPMQQQQEQVNSVSRELVKECGAKMDDRPSSRLLIPTTRHKQSSQAINEGTSPQDDPAPRQMGAEATINPHKRPLDHHNQDQSKSTPTTTTTATATATATRRLLPTRATVILHQNRNLLRGPTTSPIWSAKPKINPLASSTKSIQLSASSIVFVVATISILISHLLITHNGAAANAQSYANDQQQQPAAAATNRQKAQQTPPASPPQDEPNPQASFSSLTTSSAACFGGLQTFEKISMSSFENPTAPSSGAGTSSFGSGILVQQDDQALTSECINLCRSQSNCLSFVIDYNKFECKSYATTQQELQQEFASKFQSARAANSTTTSAAAAGDTTELSNGYQASASSSSANFQQLLPSASSNYFEKICLDGIANRNQFGDVCGQGRLWTIERVVDAFLDGFVEKEVTNVNNKDECSKLCIFEAQFVCRSADFDQHSRLCRLSKEDRRTQPQAMRFVANSNRQYLENQCATPGPSSCVYETKRNLGTISMDALKFAQTVQDCQMKCNQETTFNCRSYSFNQQRCFLSGDDSVSLNSNLIKLPQKQGWSFGEKKCLVELCTKGIFTYEKITGHTLRSALSTSIDLMMPGASSTLGMRSMRAAGNNNNNNNNNGLAEDNLQEQESSQTRVRLRRLSSSSSTSNFNNHSSSLASAMMSMMMAPSDYASPTATISPLVVVAGAADPLHESASSSRHTRSSSNLAITEHCRHSCDLGYLNCPAFTIDYKNNRCQRLDRNSQGRHHELVAHDGFAYYEKICLRVPEIMSMCQDKYWIFERVIGYELAPRLYDKSLKFVQSRRDCEEYCLEEKQFQCRSALYNDETSDCKLSRYNRRLALQEGGYYRNFNARISYLENNCVRDHNLDKSRQCYYEQARDEPAYPTFTERIEMAIGQSPGGEVESSGRVTTHSSSSGSGSDNSAARRYGASFCEQLCNDNSKFECHSFGYYASTGQCFLSGDDSISAGNLATTTSAGFTYYEKKCRLGGTASPSNSSQPNDDTDTAPPAPAPPQGGSTPTTPSSGSQSLNPYFQPPSQHNNNNNNNNHQHHHLQGYGPTTPTSELSPPPPTIPDPAVISNNNNNNNNNNDQQLNNVPRPPANDTANLDQDMYKCGVGHSFVYQRVSGFEPIGGYLTLLIKNNEQPGIVAECAELCERGFECRAFVVDYNSNECYAMLENSSVGLLSLRQTIGKDYFEGFCVTNHLLLPSLSGGQQQSCRNKTWIMDKIVDQAVVGVQHQRLIADSDRIQCRQACLEERLFLCKSAMFDSSTSECKLFSIDRESTPQMRLLFTKGVDFFENQCQIVSSSCAYDAIERDMTIVTTTKSVQARSTFDCELACNSELGFNCRAYTYLDQYPSLPNMCLLSSDSRSTSQRGSVREHPKTLYAERNCYYRRPRFPGGGGASSKYDAYSPGSSASPLTPLSPLTPSPSPPTPLPMDPYRLPSSSSSPSDEMPGLDLPARTASPPGRFGAQQPPPLRAGTEQEGGGSLGNPYELVGPALGQGACEPHQFTFERTFGYDFKLAPKERAPIAPTIGIAIGCQQECLRRGDKCQAFVVDYALPYQSCFLMETQAGSNKRLLARSPSSAYFEKVCLPRTGLVLEPPEPAPIMMSHAPMMSNHQHHQHTHLADPSQSLDISPSYSQEPWSVQHTAAPPLPATASQLPYYLQQQQLVQNYPSRSCAKLWTFERFVNYNFTAPVDKVVEGSLTRAHCETQCLNEASFTCRAATYDYANKLCRLFKNTRRTIMSQFLDLDSTQTPLGTTSTSPSASTSTSSTLVISHPGTAHVLTDSSEAIQTAASDLSKRQGGARQLSSQLQQLQQQQSQQSFVTAEPLNAGRNIDYLENTCTPEPSSCQYRQIYDQFSPYIDKVNHAVSLNDCQRQCDQERLFSCKSINYDPTSRNCMLVNEDLISLARGQQGASSLLLPKRNTVYSEKGNCEMISVQCNSQEMLVTINFDSPFRGRVMAKGNPQQCYVLGDGQTNLQFSIVFGPKCNSRQEGHNTFVNEVLIQQHPVIMYESDKTVRVMCAFEAPDQTITLKNPSSRDNKTGIDVSTSDSGRTRNDKQQFNSIVSNKAAPPSVLLRIFDQNGRDASMINLGDDLTLKIQMQMTDGKNSALGIFARNLEARSSNGESLLLIDNDGCPVDPQVFPALEIDQKDSRSLYSTFKAFRFPSSGLVNFEVQIRFCPERCQPVDCHKSGQRSRSYGRKKRDVDLSGSSRSLQPIRAAILQSAADQSYPPPPALQPIAALDSLSTVMKPGKAFEYVRKLMLPQQQDSPAAAAAGSIDATSTETTAGAEFQTTNPDENQYQEEQQNNKSTAREYPSSGNTDESSSRTVVGEQQQQQQQNEDFDSHAPPSSTLADDQHATNQVVSSPTPQLDNQQQQQPAQFSRPDYSQDQAAGTAASSNEFSPVAEEAAIGTGRSSNKAPYGHFQPTTSMTGPEIDDHTHLQTTTSPANSPPDQPSSHLIRTQPDDLQVTYAPQQRVEPKQREALDQHHASSGDQEASNSKQPSMLSSKEMPLRFSILVGENQPAQSGQVGGGVAGEQPVPVIMNSTSMDMDHIVIPGRKGHFEDQQEASSNSATPPPPPPPPAQASQTHLVPTSASYSDTNYLPEATSTAPVAGGRSRTRENNKRNASYEQTFDALPSNAVTSEIHMDQRHQHEHEHPNMAHPNHHHHHNLHHLTGQQQDSGQVSETAASHDCQVDAGASRLRAIIWTGGIVISLNVCLVLLSLAIYFRRLHLRRQNHTIVRSPSDCGTSGRSDVFGGGGSSIGGGGSVILKSKSKLGTSLNAHEHFFCKLNSKPSGASTSALEHDFNWPNLSSSSSRSTISSLASPVPPTSIRIKHQMRPSLTSRFAPFDAHSTLTSANFNTGLNDESDHEKDELTARYTSNIDVLRPGRF